MYACQGVDSKYLHYNAAANKSLGGYEVDTRAGIPSVSRQALLVLSEIGWLYRYARTDSCEPDHIRVLLLVLTLCNCSNCGGCMTKTYGVYQAACPCHSNMAETCGPWHVRQLSDHATYLTFVSQPN